MEEPDVAQPVAVVDEQSPRRTRALREIEQLLQLRPNSLEVLLYLVVVQEHPLLGLPPWITDDRSTPARHGDRAVAAELQSPEVAELEQVTDMQAVSGRVEPGVGGQVVRVESGR